MKRKKWVLASFLGLSLALTGCASGDNSANKESGNNTSQQPATNKGESSVKVKGYAGDNNPDAKEVIVATGATNKPGQYIDEDGELTGYDIEVANEIDKRLPDYQFNWAKTEFPGLFLGLDSGRYDMIVNSISKTKEREEKYLFSTEPYFKDRQVIVAKENNNEINTIEDLEGKHVIASTGGSIAQLLLEELNKTIDFKLSHVDIPGQEPAMMKEVYNGRYDATATTRGIASVYSNTSNTKFKYIDIPEKVAPGLLEANSYFLFEKGDTELVNAVHKAFTEIKSDGTLDKITAKYYGPDFKQAE